MYPDVFLHGVAFYKVGGYEIKGVGLCVVAVLRSTNWRAFLFSPLFGAYFLGTTECSSAFRTSLQYIVYPMRSNSMQLYPYWSPVCFILKKRQRAHQQQQQSRHIASDLELQAPSTLQPREAFNTCNRKVEHALLC